MSSDNRPPTPLEGILTALRAQLEGSFRSATEEIVRGLAAERDRAVAAATSDVRRQAQEQLAQLRAAAKKQNEDVRAAAEAQLADLRGKLEELRRTAQQQIDAAKRNLEAEVAAVRSKADADVEEARRAAEARLHEIERASSERITMLERDLLASRQEVNAERDRQEQARQSAEHELQAELERLEQTNQVTRMELDAERLRAEQARAAVARLELEVQQEREKAAGHPPHVANSTQMRDMVETTRALDAAQSLREVLDRLIDYAALRSERCALLFVKEDHLDSWRAIGLDAARPLQSVVTSSADAGIVGAAVREGRAAFAGTDERAAAAIPITVGDVVVAVLYADVSPTSTDTEWAVSLEVVARHASRVLETATVHRAASLIGSSSLARSHGTRSQEPRRLGSTP